MLIPITNSPAPLQKCTFDGAGAGVGAGCEWRVVVRVAAKEAGATMAASEAQAAAWGAQRAASLPAR